MLTRRELILAGAGMLTLSATGTALADTSLDMDALYDDADYSERAKAFNGTEVTFRGFMAPPLKPDAKFFVLATEPMAICPFCDTAAQWPQNILLVYPDGPLRTYNFDQMITVTGLLDLGVKTDDDTGFVSKVRVMDASYKGVPRVSIGF